MVQENNNELALANSSHDVSKGVFTDISSFENAQRMAKPLSTSQLVPANYRGKIDDCLIALEMANRIGSSPLAVLQNLFIVHGKPAWSSQFLIATVNASKKFSPLRYKFEGKEGTENWGCRACAYDIAFKELLEGPLVTLKMAKEEGWDGRQGSKWKTMPELMLRYRAATMFVRTYCPELTMGIKTADEIIDIEPVVTEQKKSRFDSFYEEEIDNDIPPSKNIKSEVEILGIK